MANFSDFTLGTITFEGIGDGAYLSTTQDASDPLEGVTLRKVTNKGNTSRLNISRYSEKDVTQPDNTDLRVRATVSISVVATDDFTPTELSALADEAAAFCTAEHINDMLLGKV